MTDNVVNLREYTDIVSTLRKIADDIEAKILPMPDNATIIFKNLKMFHIGEANHEKAYYQALYNIGQAQLNLLDQGI